MNLFDETGKYGIQLGNDMFRGTLLLNEIRSECIMGKVVNFVTFLLSFRCTNLNRVNLKKILFLWKTLLKCAFIYMGKEKRGFILLY